MGRDKQLMQARANERAECDKSCQSDIGDRDAHICSCHATRICNCPDGECADADRGDEYSEPSFIPSGSQGGDKGRGEGGDEGRSQGGIISQHF